MRRVPQADPSSPGARRSELFTENFLIPVAGLDRNNRRSWVKLGELWTVALVLNIVGGVLLILILTSAGVTRHGIKDPIARIIAMAWITGAVIALGWFNHAIVSTLELVYSMRFGADIEVSQLLENLGLAVAGNLVGGLLLVTFVRSVRAAEGTE